MHIEWFHANVPASIRPAFFGTCTIVISLSGVNADANLVRFGFETKLRFPFRCSKFKYYFYADFLLFRVSGTVFIIIIIIIIVIIIIIDFFSMKY